MGAIVTVRHSKLQIGSGETGYNQFYKIRSPKAFAAGLSWRRTTHPCPHRSTRLFDTCGDEAPGQRLLKNLVDLTPI